MSEIRDRIYKILRESKISFMEDIESQPDLFGGEDTYYKDGRQAVRFMDVLDFMSEIAPDLDYTGDKQTKDLYWMIYNTSTGSIDSNKVADIESKLTKRFGKGTVTVRLANSQYAPEIKRIYIGFVDVADVEDDSIEEAAGLEEGWKDNLKKGVATLGVAGALAGNAHAADNYDPYYDRGPHPEQSEIYKDAKYVNQYEDKVIDKDGNEWTMNQWADIVADRDPYDDRVYAPEDIDDDDVENFAKENGFRKNEDGTYTLDIDDSRFTKDELIDFMCKSNQGE